MNSENPTDNDCDLPLRWQVFLVVACFCHALSTLLASGFIHQCGGDWW